MPLQALYPLVERLAELTDTRLRFRAEVLAGSWECLEDGRADLLISSLNPDIMMTGIKHQPLQEEVMLYVAHPDHPCTRSRSPWRTIPCAATGPSRWPTRRCASRCSPIACSTSSRG